MDNETKENPEETKEKEPKAAKAPSDKDKSVGRELVRFAITGVVCAAIDGLTSFAVRQAFVAVVSGTWATVISTGIGFLVSVFVNYLMSTFWVFKNVAHKENERKAWFILVYLLLAAGGFALSVGTMALCEYLFGLGGVTFPEDDLVALLKTWPAFFAEFSFWAYFISWVIKTLVGMVWNYTTRKFILFRAPKEDKGKEEGK
jgi:putative flippase GtrA